jgi:hypothetical protein
MYPKAREGLISIDSVYGHHLPALFPPVNNVASSRKFDLSTRISFVFLDQLIVFEIAVHQDFGLHGCHPPGLGAYWITKLGKDVQV